MVRLVKLLDIVIPSGLLSLMLYGAYIAIFQVGIGWMYLEEKRSIMAAYYITTSTILLSATILFYTRLVFHTPPSPPLSVPEAFSDQSIPYECVDQDGKLGKCTKGGCNGRWKPPRSHHCAVCGECRLGFDHHCHWVGNCITMESRRLFLTFLTTATITVVALIVPIFHVVWQHSKNALEASLQDEFAHVYWWDRWYSWVLVAGPLGRWPVGAAFGYHLLAARQPTPPEWHMGYMISEPNLTPFLMIIIALGLALFTSAMALLGIRDSLQGKMTFDRMITHPRGTLYWIPATSQRSQAGSVFLCPVNINLYDSGYQRNWEDLMARPLLGPMDLERDVIPTINAVLLQELLKKETRDE